MPPPDKIKYPEKYAECLRRLSEAHIGQIPWNTNKKNLQGAIKCQHQIN